MKLHTLLLLSVVALTVGEKFVLRTPEDALAAHAACKKEYQVPQEIYEQFLNYELPQYKRTKCYVQCFVERMGLFTEERGFDEKNLIAQFTHGNTKNLRSIRHGLEKCNDNNEWDTDACTWAYRVYSCWLKINRPAVRKAYIPA